VRKPAKIVPTALTSPTPRQIQNCTQKSHAPTAKVGFGVIPTTPPALTALLGTNAKLESNLSAQIISIPLEAKKNVFAAI
jgi:hypothetical protein